MYAPDAEHVWLPGVVCQSSADGARVTVRIDPILGPSDAAVLESLAPERELQALTGEQRELDMKDPGVLKHLNARHTMVTAEGGAKGVASLPLQNASDSNASSVGYEDMILIDHLHEASILYNLRRRFFRKLPCTYC